MRTQLFKKVSCLCQGAGARYRDRACECGGRSFGKQAGRKFDLPGGIQAGADICRSTHQEEEETKGNFAVPLCIPGETVIRRQDSGSCVVLWKTLTFHQQKRSRKKVTRNGLIMI